MGRIPRPFRTSARRTGNLRQSLFDQLHSRARCLRCSLLRIDPLQRPRIIEIRDNLLARIAEAHREGWLGEAEGLNVSLAAANAKLAQADALIARHSTGTHLGMPASPGTVGRTTTSKETP